MLKILSYLFIIIIVSNKSLQLIRNFVYCYVGLTSNDRFVSLYRREGKKQNLVGGSSYHIVMPLIYSSLNYTQ
jgi:hypothetical protein